MAEYLFLHLASEAGRSAEFSVQSAGVAVIENDPAADQAIQVLSDKSITDILKHRAQSVSDDLIKEADLILTMTRSHKNRLLALYPGREEKIFTLKEYTLVPEEKEDPRYSLDIRDPFGQPVEIYEQCAGELEIHLKRLLNQI